MRILLAKCSRAYRSHFEENSESLALAYLAAVLRKNSDEVDILDASLMGLSLDETICKILYKEYDLIGFTIADQTFIESTFEVIRVLRENGVKSHITMGGHAPTFHYSEVLEMCHGLDSIVMYEGEGTLVELVDALKRNQDCRQLKGLAYRSGNGVKCNPPRPLIAELDTLPFPARDTVPYILEHKKEEGVVSMAGGRGCPMNCGFCSIRAFYNTSRGPLWRVRSNKNIVDEMEFLVHTFDIREILMIDDVFIGLGKKNRTRILKLADEVEKRRLTVMLSVADRVDSIEEDVFRRLRDVGVRNILLGIESGDQKMLDYFNKGITVEQITRAIDILRRLDIDVTVSFINFSPFTTLEELAENIKFFVSLKINILQGLLNRFQIYGGTPLGEQLLKKGLVRGSFPNFSCVSIDRRMDLVYEIAQKSLGTFLAMADELNRMERTLRKKIFEAETARSIEEIRVFQEDKVRYRKIVAKVMDEAAELLLEIIDFASSKDTNDAEKVKKYSEKMAETSLTTYNEWLGLTQFFKNYSLAYKMPEVARESTF